MAPWMTYDWVWVPLLIWGAFVGMGWLANRLIIQRLSAAPSLTWMGMVRDGLSGVPVGVGVLGGLAVAIRVSHIPSFWLHVSNQAILLLGIGFGTWVCDRTVTTLLTNAMVTQRAIPSSSIMVNVMKLLVYALGTLTALHSVGISVAPIITALGIGGLAVALALKDTLSNLFAGIQLIVSSQIRLGDYVRVGSDEGLVYDITWRNTSIQSLSGNVVIVPNTVLAMATITNYSLPGKGLTCTVTIELPIQHDLSRIESIVLDEVATLARSYSHIVGKGLPSVRFVAFTPTGVSLSVSVPCAGFESQSEWRHVLIKALVQRFTQDHVAIPHPVKEIHHIHTPDIHTLVEDDL